MSTVLPDALIASVLDASAAADQNQQLSGALSLVSFTRLQDMLQSTDGEVSLKLNFQRDETNRILLDCEISGTLPLQCQRCLGGVSQSVDLKSSLMLVDKHGVDKHGVDKHGVDKHGVDKLGIDRRRVDENSGEADTIEDREIVVCNPARLDVVNLVVDEILLGIPFAPGHEEGDSDCIKIDESTRIGDSQNAFAGLKDLLGSG
jgi:uncharacterized protein